MQSRHESILRAINNEDEKYNILTFPTHEAYQSNFASMPHTFYLYKGQNIKDWNNNFRQLPANHILLDGTENQVKLDMKFDIVLSQNKFGQFQVADKIAKYFGIPLISIEHTLPFIKWKKRDLEQMLKMRGNVNAFISNYSVKEWGFDPNDPTVRIVHHGIDTETFRPSVCNPEKQPVAEHKDGKILTVVNDYINRDWCCGWNIYRRVTGGLPINPVGDTKGFSNPAKSVDDLVKYYQNASVFLNTSTISPVPTSLLEAMSCGCPVVTTATCMIPDIVKDGLNGFISNDEIYLRDKLKWCLNNPEEAQKLGNNARQTILERFNLKDHIKNWMDIFKEVYGQANV